MWARIVELILSLWLIASPFIFHHKIPFLWGSDWICGVLMGLFALLSFVERLSKMHLLNLAAAFWLIGVGYAIQSDPTAPGLENNILVGILLLMLAIIPSHCTRSPREWEEFLKNKKK